ncbi:MAG: GGDEF domain-containing protein [Devosia marina]|uniref:GGDEF domain-containing protein n=1 Tax=Devosia marina TaxID=2683198 RepID=UPI0032ED4F5C
MPNTLATSFHTGPDAPTGEACEAQLQQGFRQLRFAPALEAQYQRLVVAEAQRPALIITLAALIIWGGFAIFDVVRLDLYATWPPAPDIMVLLGARWLVLALLLACLLPRLIRPELLEAKAFTVYLLLCLAVALTAVIYKANGIPSADTAQIVLVMAAFLPIGLRFYRALAASIAMLAFTTIAGVSVLPPDLWQGQMMLLAVMIMAVPVAAVGAYLREYAHRRQFLLGAILLHQAQFDPLTDLANRRLFQRHAAAAIAHAGRTDEPLVLAVIDIDHFKAFNDRFGHNAGDEALRQVANVIGDTARRPMDMAARLGGEEFAVLLYGTGLDHARSILETMRNNIGRIALPTGASLSVSIGATPLGGLETLDQIYDRADNLLYASKNDGRDRITLG